MPVSDRMTAEQMLIRAARGLGKVDALGLRGITLISVEEIEAMAALLAVFGLVPIPPGGAVPSELIVTLKKDFKDEHGK
jgi:hypothetical protein